MLSNFPETKILNFLCFHARSSRSGWDNMAALATTESEDPENRPPYTAPHSLIILCGLFVVPSLLRPSSFSTLFVRIKAEPASRRQSGKAVRISGCECLCVCTREVAPQTMTEDYRLFCFCRYCCVTRPRSPPPPL